MNQAKKSASEVRERSVRTVFEQEGEYNSQWAAIRPLLLTGTEPIGDTVHVG